MGVKEYFPNMFMTLLSVRYVKHATRPPQAIFKVPPKMTKHEIKEYLTKIYDLPVQRVMTANFDPKWKRHFAYGGRKIVPYKKAPAFKRAYVTLEKGKPIM
mmetsp:Transcript_24027/g.55275  ORF Transcript_24027/g.55275 Transcript_24027/m.55275 type:complete len:101 (-) Transcript_24027:46-348(-)|eukprot:CAMPEP_0182543976 /NCGR_PEP_ID=MMETSP1323-20130603/32454_1 /TAXON_ID=236787 /ORGANISM="Florenciella parvula, Strain RCC1693" /LENGTH=100 /DNA_ID=CAMNT_0024754969 /DNA_START=269 /DNA_END=571 /DNA_ORIENTATION=+